MRRLGPALLATVMLAAAIAIGASAVRGAAAPQTLDDRLHAVAATLRCPVCLNLSVADSPSAVAQEMRNQIRQELAAGMTPDQVRARFVNSYGQWILISPPKRGVTLVAWALPPLLLVLGGIVAALTVRRWTAPALARAATIRAPSEDERQALAGQLARLREEDPPA
jgi:cytochrome c-type biogenesis protein CcmH